MEYQFKADDWNRLNPVERARRCRLMAVQARELAAAASPAVQVAYARLANDWLRLADEIEKAARPTP